MATSEQVENNLIRRAADALKLADDLLALERPQRSDFAQVALKLNAWEHQRHNADLPDTARLCARELQAAGLCCRLLAGLRELASLAPERTPDAGVAVELELRYWQALASARNAFHRWEAGAPEVDEAEVELVRARVGGRTRKLQIRARCGHLQEIIVSDCTNTVFDARAAAEREHFRTHDCYPCQNAAPYVPPTTAPTPEADAELRERMSILVER